MSKIAQYSMYLIPLALAASVVGCAKDKDAASYARVAPIVAESQTMPVQPRQLSHEDVSTLLRSGNSPSDLVSERHLTYSDLSSFVRDAYKADNLGAGYGPKHSKKEWENITAEAGLALLILNDPFVKPKLDKTSRTLHSDLYLQAARGETRSRDSIHDYDSIMSNLMNTILHAKGDALNGTDDQGTIRSALDMLNSLSYKSGTTKAFNRTLMQYQPDDRAVIKNSLTGLSKAARRNYHF